MQSHQPSALESDRISELKKYNILDSFSEKEYDDIAFLASLICQVPISLISFVAEDKQWFKSHPGLNASETAREYSFCAHAINSPDEVLVVPDARRDERFKENPLVTGYPNIVFYAGAPMVNDNGYSLGTVCVIDTEPRELSDSQLKGLQALAAQVMQLLKLRRNGVEIQLAALQLEVRNKDLEQFAMIVAHDIKSPLSSIVMSNQMLSENHADNLGNNGKQLIDASTRSVKKITDLVNNILSFYKNQSGGDSEATFDLVEMLDSVAANIASPKEFKLSYSHTSAQIRMNRTQLEQIFFNLINNSIRYNETPVAKITIRFSEDGDYYSFTVTDNGIGIAKDKQDTIFNLFTTSSTSDVFGIKGHGIGLPSVKKIIEHYQGSISVSSEPGKGTAISFTIKKPV